MTDMAKLPVSPGAADNGRAPFQVLVLPYRRQAGRLEYAVFRRADAGWWQGVAGGGEAGETPLEAARRESWEEAGIDLRSDYLPLDSVASVPVLGVVGTFLWGPQVIVVPEYAFAVEAGEQVIRLSPEHTEFRWVEYAEARRLLKWDSNRVALWELAIRLGDPAAAQP